MGRQRGSLKCVIADDSALSRKIVRNALKDCGFSKVLEAASGREALRVIDASTDLVITDWNMDGMSGIELVQRVRASELPKMPILVLTARTTADDVREAIAAGANDFVAKPFTPQRLREKVMEALGLDRETPAANAEDAAGGSATAPSPGNTPPPDGAERAAA